VSGVFAKNGGSFEPTKYAEHANELFFRVLLCVSRACRSRLSLAIAEQAPHPNVVSKKSMQANVIGMQETSFVIRRVGFSPIVSTDIVPLLCIDVCDMTEKSEWIVYRSPRPLAGDGGRSHFEIKG